MADQTHFIPASIELPTIWGRISRLAAKLRLKMKKPHDAPYKPAKRFSAGLSPDMIAYDWGHLEGSDHDRFRRF